MPLVRTPIGTVGIVENGRAITDILFEEQLPGHAVRHTTLLLERAAKQLDEYFAGKRTSSICRLNRREPLIGRKFGRSSRKFLMDKP